MRPFSVFAAVCAALALTTTIAAARPIVTLKLIAAVVQTDAEGKDVVTAAGGRAVHPGDRLRYEIVATNSGDKTATAVRPMDAIPAGTEFIARSASDAAAVEFSLDGRAWAGAPTVVLHTKDGDKTVPADPATYAAIRWTTTLAAGTTHTFRFDVRVK